MKKAIGIARIGCIYTDFTLCPQQKATMSDLVSQFIMVHKASGPHSFYLFTKMLVGTWLLWRVYLPYKTLTSATMMEIICHFTSRLLNEFLKITYLQVGLYCSFIKIIYISIVFYTQYKLNCITEDTFIHKFLLFIFRYYVIKKIC